jgi:hypothetical protein
MRSRGDARQRMGVAYRHRQRVRSVFRSGHLFQTQQRLDHQLDLPLLGGAVPDNRLLDLPGHVFKNIQTVPGCGKDRHTARLSQFYRGIDILTVKNIFDGGNFGLVMRNDFPQSAIDIQETARQDFTIGIIDNAVCDGNQTGIDCVNDPVTGRSCSGIDSQNPHENTLSGSVGKGSENKDFFSLHYPSPIPLFSGYLLDLFF